MITITLTDAQVSDLFFNHEHPNFSALFGGDEGPTQDEMRDAITLDARQFNEDLDDQLNEKWLVDEFMNRL